MSAEDALERLKELSTEETFKVKSKAMALVLLDACYDHVTSVNEPAPFSQKLDMLKTAAKFADLEPKQFQPNNSGGGFSIRVVYSGAGRGAVTIDHDDVVLEIDAPPNYLAPSPITDSLAALRPSV
jgi:hypothetical protein